MNDDNTPKPGTAEYDAMMAARYRGQGKEQPLTSDGQPSSSYENVTAEGVGAFQVRKGSTLGPPRSEGYTAAQADPGQVKDLEREIERVRAELDEVIRFDPVTGEPVMRVTGEARRMREIQLANWENVELPATRAMVERAQAWRAQNVATPQQKLEQERDRREAVKARAEAIALEREAEAAAAAIAKRRASES